MTNYPRDILEAYAKRQINKEEFIEQFSEWQKANGINYSFKKIVNGLDVCFMYQNITATIKNNKLHFKTDKNDTASTPFEFRRKVDFYYANKEKEITSWL